MLSAKLFSVVAQFSLWVATLYFPEGACSAPTKAGDQNQNLVTWDEHSIFIRGERIMLFSGEFHPFRLPVPDLWLDVLQKIKSMGFTGASFYTNWALLEGNPGHIITDGIWNLEKLFQAATEAGIYLIARPGPYINAETTAGGIPGWALRNGAIIRSGDPEYLNMTNLYMSTVAKAIEKAQITHGGPVIMVQPENEYTTWPGDGDFPSEMNRQVMEYAEKQLTEAGITVPLIVNDNEVKGYWAPGSGRGAADIYGIDAYPLRYDCAHPDIWPTYRFPYDWQVIHEQESPNTPFAIAEFQGGSGGGWGGVTEDMCAALVNAEASRVVYKNNYGFGVKIFNIYMTYGGTNWGNLGYMGGYTSYDYGAAITETREVWREKFSEQKLQANFLKVSPSYLTAKPGIGLNGSYGTPASVSVTPVLGRSTNFFVVRHADFTSQNQTKYNLTLPTSGGNITIPQLGGSLSLNDRDSKIHVTDYDLDGINLLYSFAEIFTWARGPGSTRVLILYGGADETHELAVARQLGNMTVVEGDGVTSEFKSSSLVIHWQVKSNRRIIRIGHLEVHLLWRNDAYNYWVMELPAPEPIGNFSSPSKDLVIVKAGYLVRSARVCNQALCLSGDVNSTTEIEIISIPRKDLSGIVFNGEELETSEKPNGKLSAVRMFDPPVLQIPVLGDLDWRYLDSLPELQSLYDDSNWTSCVETTTNNPRELNTPRNLYAMDYGFHTGSLIYRGHFTANSDESYLWLNISGGTGFGHSVWVNNTFLGSWVGSSDNETAIQNLTIKDRLLAGQRYVVTILIDNMGQDEEAPGTDAIKFPKGILNYDLSAHGKSEVKWKVTGNLGGEQYRDLVRGPLNEGAMYAERQGYHYPEPPSSHWEAASPIKDGLKKAGVGFFTTSFDLRVPMGWDIPMMFIFNQSFTMNATETHKSQNYRCQLFINGYQFGKYVNNLGPQVAFPVPEGILRHNGTNYIALTLWAQDQKGGQVGSLELKSSAIILSGHTRPKNAPQSSWTSRIGAY